LGRLETVGAGQAVIDHARNKVKIEQFRTDLPAARIRRILLVLKHATPGDNQRYCSQG
jgi:hypothetical protein